MVAADPENQSASAERDAGRSISPPAAVQHLASMMTKSPIKTSRAVKEKFFRGLRPYYKQTGVLLKHDKQD